MVFICVYGVVCCLDFRESGKVLCEFSAVEMKKILTSMLPAGASIPENEEEIEFSIAIEYHGPPLSCDLPRAIPVDIKSIPVASMASPNSSAYNLVLPVVQPIATPDRRKTKPPPEANASPISVIAFEDSGGESSNRELSGQCSGSSVPGTSNGNELLDPSNDFDLFRDRSTTIDSLGSLESNENSDHSHRLSSDSASCSQCVSSEISLVDEEEPGNVQSRHVRRTSAVTFHESSGTTIPDDSNFTESGYTQSRIPPEKKVDNGTCYTCSKRFWYGEKETCIVCNAKYCARCVLKAMGSMPEGRKCVYCIGYPIDESKRRKLGKCSRMLRRLLSEPEIRQLRNIEKFCEANQLQGKLIYINGKRLSQEELLLLQSCPKPPIKLKPGHYWYDHVSGLWGKKGEKPSDIISARLNIGGDISRDASNGNTNILINNREITKVELRLLRLTGVQCAGNPHFWLDENGSYREEGQKNEKGKLWDKAGTKLLCAFLSLPTPSRKLLRPSPEEVNNLVSGAIPDYIKKRTRQKLLLVGYNGSGTSTIFKQAKILLKKEPFTVDERQEIKFMIQRNVYNYIAILLEARERFEDESLAELRRNQPGSTDEGSNKSIYSINPRLKDFSDWLLEVKISGNMDVIFPAACRDYSPRVEELWKDAAIQATFDRRSELKLLPSVASYFLDRVSDITMIEYEPSNMDILYADGITSANGIACMDFSIPRTEQQGGGEAASYRDSSLRYQLVRIEAKGLGGHCKWLGMFEDVRMVFFCVALCDYDQIYYDGSGTPTNKMLASKKLFENMVTHPSIEKTDFLLILSKYDLLEEKIERVPLSECDWFNDFNLVRSNHPSNNNFNYIASPAEQASHYIASKFKKLYNSLTGRKLYVSMVNGLEPVTISGALDYSREILKWDEDKINFNPYDSISNMTGEIAASSR